MSFEAMIWAHRQTCGNVARKAVLMALANWADAAGFVRALLFEHLGQATELSRTGVFARLRELEVGGALTRERGHHADGRTVSVKLRLEGSFSLFPTLLPRKSKKQWRVRQWRAISIVARCYLRYRLLRQRRTMGRHPRRRSGLSRSVVSKRNAGYWPARRLRRHSRTSARLFSWCARARARRT
jgi:hypothetical protein